MPKIKFISSDNESQVVDVRGGVSVQEAAIQNSVQGIDADCGGGCTCATCHVFVAAEWMDKVGRPGELEISLLEALPNHAPGSRLACQIKMSDQLDGLIVVTPERQIGI